MAKTAEGEELLAHLSAIVRDSGKLLEQQVDLLRAEVRDNVRQAGAGAAAVAAGGGLSAAGGLLGGMMLAHLLHRATRLPLWASYGVVGGTMAATGVKLLQGGVTNLGRLGSLPETTAAARENWKWLKRQIDTARD